MSKPPTCARCCDTPARPCCWAPRTSPPQPSPLNSSGTGAGAAPTPPLNLLMNPAHPSHGRPPFLDITRGRFTLRAVSLIGPESAKRLRDLGLARAHIAAGTSFQRLQPDPKVLWVVAGRLGDPALRASVVQAVQRLGPAIVIDRSGSARAQGRDWTPLDPGNVMEVTLPPHGRAAAVLHLDRRSGLRARFEVVPASQERSHLPWASKLEGALHAELVRAKALLRSARASPVAAAEERAAPSYVGAGACSACHAAIHEAWRATAHAPQPGTAKIPPSPSCVRCHDTGWHGTQEEPRRDASAFLSAEATPHLQGVGCEACHGPASLHVLDPWHTPPPLDASTGCAACHDAWSDPDFAPAASLPRVDHRAIDPAQRTRVPPAWQAALKRAGRGPGARGEGAGR